MSKPSSSESLQYERYVDGLRQANAAMAAAIRNMIDAGDDLIAAIDGSTDQFEPETAAFSAAVSAAEKTLPDFEQISATTKVITVTIEGGTVQDVTGVPKGYELHVEDRDDGDESHPSWDAEKECFVSIYEGYTA
jgi:hypothetical protein